ncbi:MAG: IMP cyclohydrolase [Nitrospirae bacterium]|nr:IMP cyclohydrolase [Nitrospirota bacterium]
MPKIKRAIISVSDKKGVVDFAKALHSMGVEILSTGGTAKALRDAGVSVKDVSDYTGFPEMMDGRLKTLHPKVHGGLLARRDNPKDIEDIKEYGIELIDMIVVNLYPFEETIAKPNVTFAEAIENIDIGGPTMLRSASKNFKDVVVVTDANDYEKIIKEMKENKGVLSYKTRLGLAIRVFRTTSRYDGAIADYLTKEAEKK